MSLNLQAFNGANFRQMLDDFDSDFSLTLIIGLATGLGVLFVILLMLTVYFTFFSNRRGIFLGSSFNIPGEFDDEQGRINDEVEYLPKMKEHERENYFAGRQFQETFPPDAKPLESTLSDLDNMFISERGIQSYVFEQPDEHTSVPSVVVEDKLDVRFSSDEPNSAILNYPLPVADNDTVYFEVKLFELPQTSTVCIGVATKPYPLFRLPGYNRYSIAYESNGKVRINQPFYTPAIWDTLIEGDVVGCGFKPRSGTVFFTHNGKKIVEAAHNVKFDMYPIIGSQGPSKLEVNLGQLGYVFIEANVKKWGFGSVYGTIGIPPAYGNELGEDTVLDRGEELPPTYPSEEETFFGPAALQQQQQQQRQATHSDEETVPENRPSKIISKPPSYVAEPKEALKESTPVDATEVSERLYERQSSLFDQENNNYDPLATTSELGTPNAVLTTETPSSQDRDTQLENPISAQLEGSTSTSFVIDTHADQQTSDETVTESSPTPSASSSSNKNKTKSKKKSKKKGKKKGRK